MKAKRLMPKGVYANHKRLASGKLETYYYLRGHGALKPLPGDDAEAFHPGSLAFMRAYVAAQDAPRRARVAGTLQSLIDQYKKSSAFAKLAPRTKSDYLAHLAKIEAAQLVAKGPALGAYPLDVIEDPKIRRRFLDWRDSMAKRSPRQADQTLSLLHIVLEFGRDRGIVAHNHASRPKKVYRADRSDKVWLAEHLEVFREVAPPEMRLALELALWTGQRQGDLLCLPWTAYKDGRLSFRQGKRQRKVDMPVHSVLANILDVLPKKATTILTTAAGRLWGKINFQHHWRAATLAAGLDGLHFHDLRGTTCTMLADAGCTPSEIAAMLGWTVSTVNQMLDRYQMMTAAQSNSAIAKLEARR